MAHAKPDAAAMPQDGIRKMRALLVLTAFLVCLPGLSRAAELVMFESELCEWCDIWKHDIGVVYGKTPEGQMAPLRRVDIDDDRPDDLQSVRRVIFTPTFVLMSDGNEVGRITGYPGEHHFWGLLNELLQQMNGEIDGCPQGGERLVTAGENKEPVKC